MILVTICDAFLFTTVNNFLNAGLANMLNGTASLIANAAAAIENNFLESSTLTCLGFDLK